MTMKCADRSTGEIYLGKTIEKPCGSRLHERCPHCSEIYARDARSVFNGGVEHQPEPVEHFTFVTLTAPGSHVFGQTHQRVQRFRKGKKPYVVRCACKHVHRQDDVQIGSPIDPSTYRYDLAAEFNAASSRLLAITLQRVGRMVGEKLSYARVAEFQKRGLIHFHILIKGQVPAEVIRRVVLGTEDGEGNAVSPAVSHQRWRWGEQVDVKDVRSDDRKHVGAYLTKLISYSIKGTDTSSNGTIDSRAQMQRAALRGCDCKAGGNCALGKRYDPENGTFFAGEMPDKYCRRHQLAYNGWGFRGHILAFSRNWGMTFKEVRQRRSDYAKRFIRESKTFAVIGWQVLGPARAITTQIRV